MSNQYTTTLNEEQRKVRDELHSRTVRLENELDKLIKMFTFARESLENEMLEGLGYKQKGLHDSFAKKLKELTLGMNSLVSTKIQYDKAKRALAATMTPEEEMSAVVDYVAALSADDWVKLKDRIKDKGRWLS